MRRASADGTCRCPIRRQLVGADAESLNGRDGRKGCGPLPAGLRLPQRAERPVAKGAHRAGCLGNGGLEPLEQGAAGAVSPTLIQAVLVTPYG